MSQINVILLVVGAVLGVLVLLLALSPKARTATAQKLAATAPPPAPTLIPAASHAQLLAAIVSPVFEDAVSKKRDQRLIDAMLDSYVSQRHPDEVEAPAAPVPKPPATA